MAAALDEVKDELNDHVVLAPQDFYDPIGDPSAQQQPPSALIALSRDGCWTQLRLTFS